MKFPLIIFLLSLYITPLSAHADQCTQWFNEGVEFHLNKNYQNASKKFEQVYLKCGQSEALFINLGNSFLEQNEIGKARLYYEKALLQYGRSKILNQMLSIVKKKITQPIYPPLFSLEKIRQLFKEKIWTLLSIVTFLLCCISIGILIISKKLFVKKLGIFIAISCLILTLFNLLNGYLSKQAILSKNTGIIIEKEITFRSEPNLQAPKLLSLHSGIKIKIVKEQNEWTYVSLEDGKMGWIQTQFFTLI